ncbi:hypothetical protein COV11_04385 [Candidatus Woesearchaeota archaeon CG10_big_fil_rev_8_21_14_0_10_30_7]|nr:MAG: hypothetical protein COV11_04385 [Candidatus Woesearchaeota archaeon CG10_big_fil_rev_8_21_14_0_10_30_7]
MVLIGLTSFNGGGKDVISEYLKKNKGFASISLSDMLREECKKRGLALTRDNLIDMGNELRDKHGLGVLGKLALEKVKLGDNIVITSFRHPNEVFELKKHSEFVLVKVLADQKIRFERIKARNREEDPKTFEEFQKLDLKEVNTSDPHKQKIDQCVALADFSIINEGSFEDLHEKIEELLKNVEAK